METKKTNVVNGLSVLDKNKILAELDEIIIKDETNNMVPIQFIVKRLISQAYSNFINLVETYLQYPHILFSLPSMRVQQRPIEILNYFIKFRYQFVKLNVLLMSMKNIDNLSICNVI